MKKNSGTNLFAYYRQEENQFTNGLISLLELSKLEDESFIHIFFLENLSINILGNDLNFKVLKDIDGTPDGEISNENIIFFIETKIESGSLRKEQIKSHLKRLYDNPQKNKKLMLLTPDDSASEYIKQFLKLDPSIIHLEWKKVYNYMCNWSSNRSTVFSEIVSQYLLKIHDRIFEQDIVAVIVKIDFGNKSEVYPDRYLDEMKRGKWVDWHTPRKYKNLDGKGRKLILYDRTKKAITVEVEIREVMETKEAREYPWSNKFIPETLKTYKKPIIVENIRKISGFENFGVHRKDRTPIRNLTHEQYRELMKYG